MSVTPCLACASDAMTPRQIDSSTVLQLRARACQSVPSGSNVAWILHWSEIRFFPSSGAPLATGDAVEVRVLGTSLSGTVTALASRTVELTLVNTFLVNTLSTTLVVTLHVLRGHVCAASSSATGPDYRFDVVRLSPAACVGTAPLLDVRWEQTAVVQERVYPMVQEGAGEHRMLNGVDTYFITQNEESDHLALYNVATGTDDPTNDNALTLLPLDEADPAGWLQFYDAATGDLVAEQNAAFNHDSNKIPISSDDFAGLPAYDMESPSPVRLAVKLRVRETTAVPVGYFVFGRNRRLNIALGESLLNAEPELANVVYFSQLRHARFSEGAGTLVQQRRVHYKLTPSLGSTEIDKQVFAVVLEGIPFVLALKTDIGIVTGHEDSGDFALTLVNLAPERMAVHFQTGDAVQLQGILGTLSAVSGAPLDSTTTYFIQRTGDVIQLYRDRELQTLIEFTETTPGTMPFFIMHEHKAATHGQHGGEMVVLEDHPEDVLTTLPTTDLVPGTFNDQSGSYLQVFGDNPAIVVGSK